MTSMLQATGDQDHRIGEEAQRAGRCRLPAARCAIASCDAQRSSVGRRLTAPPSRRCPAAPRLSSSAGGPSNFLMPSCRPITRVQKSQARSTSWMLQSTGMWNSRAISRMRRHHLARDLRVEARGRLVDQQQLRVLDQRAGDADALALAAGKPVGALVDVLAQADPVEQAQRLGDVVLGVHAQDAAQGAGVAEPAGQHVVHHRQPLDQVELLEDHADVAALQPHLGIRQLEQVDAVEQHLAAVRLDQPVDAADQRRLAGAARADDRRRSHRARA